MNTVQPGPLDADMNPAERPFAESLTALMALPRYVRGDEIAEMGACPVSLEAGFVTGTFLPLDGGFAA